MKQFLLLCFIICFCGTFFGADCAEQVSSVNEAIKNAQSLKTVQEKITYLIQQAQTFYNSQKFQQAIQTAQYILSNLDKNSQPAKSLIEKAKAQLQAVTQNAMSGVGGKLFGK